MVKRKIKKEHIMKKNYFSKTLSIIFLFSIFVAYSLTDKTIIENAKNNNVTCIDFQFTDLAGSWRSITLPIGQLGNALKNGLSFDGSSIPGCTNINESDLFLKPDLSTFALIHNNGQTHARIICEIYRTTDVPFEADPRSILKKALREANDLGYTFLAGPELEFFLFIPQENNDLIPLDQRKYFQAEYNLQIDSYKKELLSYLHEQGINIEKIHHEVAPGQYEVSIHYADALHIADQIMLCKHAIKSFAQKHSLAATFMPKPLQGCNGSGMHIHFSLFDTNSNKNAFYKSDDSLYLSPTAYSFIAGVLYYASELSALFNASINSYKRLVPGHEAPIYRCWATKNRSAMIRIPQINPDQSNAARAEIRSPDALCNPYLALAGLLKAGLEGIKKNIQLAKAAEVNLYHLTPAELMQKGIDTLPTSLMQSLILFEKSSFIASFLATGAITQYSKIKKDELASFSKAITDWEKENYL